MSASHPLPIGEALRQAEARLEAHSDSPRRDAEVLLGAALAMDRAALYAHLGSPVPNGARSRFADLLAARRAGTPIAYLLGEREFWSLPLAVDPQVLIPRPETEHLVELALAVSAGSERGDALDLGTGSGAIALAFASERPGWRVRGIDCSAAAVAVAEQNRRRLGLDNVEFRAGDWYRGLEPATFDLICANPPYVASDDPHLTRGDPHAEPRLALDGGADGLAALREVIGGAPGYLRRGGSLLLEHGSTQGAAVRALCAAAGLVETNTACDYACLERVTSARRRAP